MQLVINISEHNENVIKRFVRGEGFDEFPPAVIEDLIRSVYFGTTLPEHHERLVEKINSKKIYKGRASYSDMHDADMDKIHDIALDKAIEIIKKYS